MLAETQRVDWEADLTALLDELSNVQTELLDVLAAKRESMASSDWQQMVELHPRAKHFAIGCDPVISGANSFWSQPINKVYPRKTWAASPRRWEPSSAERSPSK